MKNKKKILFLCSQLNAIGGIQKYNKDLIFTLKKLNYKVYISERKTGFLVSKIFFFIKALYLFFSKMPNLIICSHINYSILPLLFNYLFNKKFIVIFYGIDAMDIKSKLFIKAIEKSHRIIVISDYTKNILKSQFKIDNNKFFLLPSAVDKKKFKLAKNLSKLKQGFKIANQPVIATISRLSSDEDKGQHRVLLALKKVLKKYPKCKYIIAGPGEDDRVNRVLLEDTIINKATVILGKVSEKEKIALYNLCDVFILPSKKEGFAIVFIEALMCGAQVVASNQFGCPEILLNKKLGHVIDPDNQNQISEKIIKLLKISKKRSFENRKKIRLRAIEEFDISTWQKKVNLIVN